MKNTAWVRALASNAGLGLALFLLVSCSTAPKTLETASSAAAAPPSAPDQGSSLPPGWRLMSEQDGSRGEVRFDFDGGGLPDFVGFAVNQAGKPALFVERNRSGRFELYLLSTDLGFCRLGFDSKKKIITLSQDSGGSSSGESFEAKFRFQDGDFFLIGAKKEESTYGNICGASRSCGSDTYEINYLTGEVRENVGGAKSRAKQKIAPLINLKAFKFEMIFP